jgi:hypothetical protein
MQNTENAAEREDTATVLRVGRALVRRDLDPGLFEGLGFSQPRVAVAKSLVETAGR